MSLYKTLSSSLNWPTGHGHPSTTTLLTSISLEPTHTFLIPHFLTTSTSDKQSPFLLLSFTQTLSHYTHILRKQGINQTKHKTIFINALNTQNDLGATLPQVTRPDYTLRRTEWPEFFKFLDSFKQCTLFIDGVCSLLDLGEDVEVVGDFVVGCKRIVEGNNGRLIVGLFLDEFTDPLVSRLVRSAHYYLGFEPLASGSSADVSGQLTVVPGHLYCQVHDSSQEFKPMLLHYRVSDTTVQFFSPGQSRIVL
ncbi:Elongator subunit elp6 [Coemansia asiatica]|uniref:Elongator subunit elp6 n=1 Tax=Coemansia asiatica TaxID=1052880 RepID=A0A9W7XHE9_9FUNG|nr:Elongator subunit elp6 [Coemansia asiatica]KAJ2887640.1 Elongator subunit elp6 [Coemansia asiatica]